MILTDLLHGVGSGTIRTHCQHDLPRSGYFAVFRVAGDEYQGPQLLKARRGRRWRIRELWPPGLASPPGSLLPQYNDRSLVTHYPCLTMSWGEHGRFAKKSFIQVCFSISKLNERYGSQEPRTNLAEGLLTLSVALHAAVPRWESGTSCRADRTQRLHDSGSNGGTRPDAHKAPTYA